jgi:uncharacterized membrane protein YeaQ/YmgE (transglycosylase-associated protein family)
MRLPNSGLPEFGIMIVQVGNSRLGCADPESRPGPALDFRVRSLSDKIGVVNFAQSSRPGLTVGAAATDWSRHAERLSLGSKRSADKPFGANGGIFMQMSNEGIIVILFVGLVAGWLAGKIVRGTGFGIIGDILVGIAGALVASYLFPRLGIHLGTGLLSEIIYSAIGAILLLLIVRLIRTGGRF